jgi:hypothetical protein
LEISHPATLIATAVPAGSANIRPKPAAKLNKNLSVHLS